MQVSQCWSRGVGVCQELQLGWVSGWKGEYCWFSLGAGWFHHCCCVSRGYSGSVSEMQVTSKVWFSWGTAKEKKRNFAAPLLYFDRTIDISSSGAGFLLLPKFFGNFSVMEGVFMDGKPVYRWANLRIREPLLGTGYITRFCRNSAGRYLHLDSFNNFGIRTDFSGDGASVQVGLQPLAYWSRSHRTENRSWYRWTSRKLVLPWIS